MQFVMVNDVPESQKAPQQQQLAKQWDQHQKQSTATHTYKCNDGRAPFLLVDSNQHPLVSLTLHVVCGLQFGRAVQIKHSCQSWHGLHQELRSVPFSLCPPFLPTLLSNWFIQHVLSLGNSASETCAEFRVKYVGAIENLQFNMSKTLQEPLDLIGYIDAAQVKSWRIKLLMQTKKRCCKICFISQQDGKLPFVPGDKEMILGVSKYGVKVASLDQCVSTTVIYRIVVD